MIPQGGRQAVLIIHGSQSTYIHWAPSNLLFTPSLPAGYYKDNCFYSEESAKNWEASVENPFLTSGKKVIPFLEEKNIKI